MKWYEWGALGALGLAGLGAGYRALKDARAEKPVEAPATQTPSGLKIRSAFDLAATPADLEQDADKAGHIRFEVGPKERVVGVTTAVAFPTSANRPRLAEGKVVHMLQAEDGTLDVRPWLGKARPSGTQLLRFALRLETAAGTEYRAGTATINPSDLFSAGVAVKAPRRMACRITVRTEGGQAIPGAVLFLDSSALGSSALRVGVETGEDGWVTVSGLDDDREWIASLPAGIGPETAPIESVISARASEVVLTVPVRGEWAFEPFAVLRPLPGMGAITGDVVDVVRALPALWPVTSLVLPGTGKESLFVLMRRATSSMPKEVTIAFRGLRPIRVGTEPGERRIDLALALAAESPVPAAPISGSSSTKAPGR